MKIVIATDKFKGSLSSFEVCAIIKKAILAVDSSHEVSGFPMADGGDGFAEVLKYYLGTETIVCNTVDPLCRAITASYEKHPHSRTVIIEMAVASGLLLLKENERNPLKTSTFGTGVLIKDAIKNGATTIVLGLGGSATNDAGMGILAAMGFEFTDEEGNKLNPSGESLAAIKNISVPASLPAVQFDIACDVQNVLYGEQGAAFVYASQKGADERMIKQLDEGLKNFASLLKQQFNKEIAFIPGTGAAGGIAAGLMAFFNVKMKRGIDMILDVSNINSILAAADMLITGEGKIDRQSTQGKVVGRMAQLATNRNIPCIAFCGLHEFKPGNDKLPGIEKTIPLVDTISDAEYSMKNAQSLLEQKVTEFFKNRR
jgi:glycerate kinase